MFALVYDLVVLPCWLERSGGWTDDSWLLSSDRYHAEPLHLHV